jgi:hypothetical protein
LVSGCPGGSEEGSGLVYKDGGPSASDASNPMKSIFKIYEVPECGLAGYQTVAAAGAGKVAFATLATTSKTAPCAIEGRTQAATALNDVCVVLPSDLGFTGSIVTSQPYAARMGVGLAMDQAGEPVLAYTGGPTAAIRCGASDMLTASVSGGKLGTPQTIAAGSASTGMPADQAIACSAQNVCNQGDATGYWPSLALDPASGNLGVAFRDLHFGFADTDFASSDVEFALGPGYAVYTVDVARGGGTYNRLAFTSAGMAAVVHYAEAKPAIWVDWQTAAGWKSQKLIEGKIGEQLGFAISSQGLYALAYFDSKQQVLMYLESADGSTWTAPESVDSDGVVGNYPSLAFDGQGNPAIAYYRCNDSNASSGCSTEKDGLFLARRQNGAWLTRKISGDSGSSDGLYTALAFVNGKAVIAFQTTYFDPVAGASKAGLSVAKEM